MELHSMWSTMPTNRMFMGRLHGAHHACTRFRSVPRLDIPTGRERSDEGVRLLTNMPCRLAQSPRKPTSMAVPPYNYPASRKSLRFAITRPADWIRIVNAASRLVRAK
jgi:hypothetical protein